MEWVPSEQTTFPGQVPYIEMTAFGEVVHDLGVVIEQEG
jgi:hypothetical protein